MVDFERLKLKVVKRRKLRRLECDFFNKGQNRN